MAATNPQSITKCPSSNKYCDPNTVMNGCTDTTTDATCSSAPTFTCTSEGYFPDPYNCSLYYYCPMAAADPANIIQYECPANFAYNSRTRNCQRRLLMAPRCQPMDCTGKEGKFIVNSQNNGYYAYCSDDPTQAALTLFKCPDADNQVFNPAKLGCEYKCRREGFFADTLDCKSYYFCHKDLFHRLSYVHETCPALYKYEDGSCVKTEVECNAPAMP